MVLPRKRAILMGMKRILAVSLAASLLTSCAGRQVRFQPSKSSADEFWGFKTPADVVFARFDRSPPNPDGIQFACAAGVLTRHQLVAVLDLNVLPDPLDPGEYGEFGFKNCVPHYRELCDDPNVFELYVNNEISVVACNFGGAVLVKVGIRTYGGAS
jgi:hypothetical protein